MPTTLLALALAVPACLADRDAVRDVPDRELLARLVFAEGTSTNVDAVPACRARGGAVFEAIAWGVINRVRLGEASPALRRKYGDGLRGVVFAPGQFNPAISKRSRFARLFRCPTAAAGWEAGWARATAAADAALGPPARNPFLLTDWERTHGLSLVAHFYYPRSSQATAVPPPWTDPRGLVRDAVVAGLPLGTDCVWFFRLERPFVAPPQE